MKSIHPILINPIEFEEFHLLTDIDFPGVEEERYKISNIGRLFDNKRNSFCSDSISSNGYRCIYLNINGVPKQFLLHRVVALSFVKGNKSLIVNHIDGHKWHCCDENLEWTTYSGNNNHAFENNLMPRGEYSPKAIVSDLQVHEICKLLDEQKFTYDQIAEKIGINSPDSSALISAIKHGISWKQISKEYKFSENNYKSGRYKILRT